MIRKTGGRSKLRVFGAVCVKKYYDIEELSQNTGDDMGI
jgi:hypothetical protein